MDIALNISSTPVVKKQATKNNVSLFFLIVVMLYVCNLILAGCKKHRIN